MIFIKQEGREMNKSGSIVVVAFSLLSAVSSALVAANAYADRVIMVNNTPPHQYWSTPRQAERLVVVPQPRHYRGFRAIPAPLWRVSADHDHRWHDGTDQRHCNLERGRW
jgi:hypothetical protein